MDPPRPPIIRQRFSGLPPKLQILIAPKPLNRRNNILLTRIAATYLLDTPHASAQPSLVFIATQTSQHTKIF